MTDAQNNRLSLSGFSKESVEMIRELQSFGWVFRRSNHGAVGHAPNDKTTISISRSLNKNNRSLHRAQSDFRRWLRIAHPEITETADEYIAEQEKVETLAETDPVTAGILERRAIVRAVEQIDTMVDSTAQERLTRFHQEATNQKNGDTSMAQATLTDSHPWHGKTGVRDGLTRVIERTWSNGRIDFACAYEGCPVTSYKPRSITQHYGAVHTRPVGSYIGTPIGAPKPVEVTPAATEGEGLPWEALAETVEELREAEPEPIVNLDPPEEHPVTKQMINAQYGEAHDMTVHVTSEAAVMLTTIQEIVSKPLLERVKILGEQVETLTKERDEAREHLAKIQADWNALRSLLGGVNSD